MTKKATMLSTRNVAICVSTSVLASPLPAHLFAAPAGSLHRAHEALGELLLLEYVQRRLGRAVLGGHVFAQDFRRIAAFHRQLRRAEDRVLRQLERVVFRNAELHR